MAGVRMFTLMMVCCANLHIGHSRIPGWMVVHHGFMGLGSLDCTVLARPGWHPRLGADIAGLAVSQMSQAVVSWCVLVGFEPGVVMWRLCVHLWNHFEGLSQRPIVR